MRKITICVEIVIIIVAFLLMLGVAAMFFLGAGFDSPIQLTFFAMGLLVALTSIYLAVEWASEALGGTYES